ncbi:MAG TPA: MFS transporter [Mycobacteriales bacterium]|jgi:MFS family permease|nr:MFS transporter [Mycobacteriales bacterium]
MTPMQRLRRDTFASLSNPNYRLYFGGQAISLVGTWMQTIAQSFLVLHITGSGFDVGLIVALQTLPVLLLGPYAGVVADRVDKRKMMIGLQSLMGVQALVFGILTLTHVISLWQIAVLAMLLGLNNTFENPARQTFVMEMVGPTDLRNAVTLNSVLVNVARAVGPAVAGIIIAAGGYGVCFLINAASFIAVVASLLRMDVSMLAPAEPTRRGRGQLREGIRYVRSEVGLAIPLVMMAIVGCLAYEFQVTLPVMATRAFHGGSVTYGFMTASMGVGAVIGGLYAAGRGKTGLASLTRSCVIFTVVIAAAALAPDLTVELIALAAVGAASVTLLSKGNSTLQLAAAPQMRGRVMALWAVAFLGSTPIGGPAAGAVAQYIGPRWGLGLGALACALAALLGGLVLRRVRALPITETRVTTATEEEAEAVLEVAEAAR